MVVLATAPANAPAHNDTGILGDGGLDMAAHIIHI